MTQIIDIASATPARERIQAWLADFEAALAARDIDAASEMFANDSYWRDLMAFTGSVNTVEGPDEAGDLLGESLGHVAVYGFKTIEEPICIDGFAEAWVSFETTAGPGRGHLRVKDEMAWTFLTTLQESGDR